jgi:uncharacterized protein YcfJ
MKLLTALAIGGIALAAVPASAQMNSHTTTTVTRVHGPLKVLPHHKRKICRVTTFHHRRTKKCWYH